MKKEPRILYVDDEHYMLDCMAATFEIAELSISTASSADKALEILAASHSYQVIISDYRMHGMNGIEFLSVVSKKYPDTTRILCSAYMNDDNMMSCIADGTIHHFVHKPWDINQLIGLVCTELEKAAEAGDTNDVIPKFMPFSKSAAAY